MARILRFLFPFVLLAVLAACGDRDDSAPSGLEDGTPGADGEGSGAGDGSGAGNGDNGGNGDASDPGDADNETDGPARGVVGSDGTILQPDRNAQPVAIDYDCIETLVAGTATATPQTQAAKRTLFFDRRSLAFTANGEPVPNADFERFGDEFVLSTRSEANGMRTEYTVKVDVANRPIYYWRQAIRSAPVYQSDTVECYPGL